MIDSKVLNSPIRWAGSKKKILNEMLNAFKPGKNNYIECFLGSGVVLINVLKNNDKLKYKNFFVNDINSNVINFYKLLQKKPEYLIKEIIELATLYNNYDLSKKEEYYYGNLSDWSSRSAGRRTAHVPPYQVAASSRCHGLSGRRTASRAVLPWTAERSRTWLQHP